MSIATQEETIPGIISSPTKNPLRSTTSISEEDEEEEEETEDAAPAQSPTAQTSATRAATPVDEELQPPFLVERPEFKPPTLTVRIFTLARCRSSPILRAVTVKWVLSRCMSTLAKV